MFFKNPKSFLVRFALTLMLLGGAFGALPALASGPVSTTENGAPPNFAPYITFLVEGGYATGIGDFNTDGLQDVAMTASTQLMIFLQNSDGSLAIPVTYDAGSRPEALAAGDLNGDGRTDIAVANYTSNLLSIFLQQVDGTLAERFLYTTNSGPDALAIGDVNSDGLADIVVSHWTAANIGVITQSAAGTLNPMVTYASPQAGWDDIAIADINNDGRNDVIKMNGQGLNPNLSVYLQNAEATLASALSYSVMNCGSFCQSHGLGTGDVTGDGLTDIVLSFGGNRPYSQIAVFAQGTDGSLQPPVAYKAYDIPEPVEVSDVNGDGLADVLVAHGGWNTLSVFPQQSDGTLNGYTPYTLPYTSHYSSQALSVGDLNHDGLNDVAIASSNTGLVILYQLSPATPTPTFTLPPTDTPTAIPPSPNGPLFLSLSGSQALGNVISADEDILRFDGQDWSLWFDGSDVGVANQDLVAFSILDEDMILMSFNSAVTVNGIYATPQDVLSFDAISLGSTTAGTFSLYFDGSDVGLNTAAENIDALSLLFDGRLLISTTGNPLVPGISGARDEDVLGFLPTSLGNVTSGTWSMYFDGSDVGLADTSGEDVDAFDVVGENILLSTLDDFAADGLSGADEDVFVCVAGSTGTLTVCNYSPILYFDGSLWGLDANNVDAFNFLFPEMNTPTPPPPDTPTPFIDDTPTPWLTDTPTPFIDDTPTPWLSETPTPFEFPTITPTSTSVVGCESIRNSVDTLKVTGTTMYLDIPNPNVYPVALNNIIVSWNYAQGHVGSDTSLHLLSVALNGSVIWTGDVYAPSYLVPYATRQALPAGETSRITFTFHQTYNRLANEELQIDFATWGCEYYPIHVIGAVRQ